MDAHQNLYYALGILSYAIAKADGVVQVEERNIIHKIVTDELDHNLNFNYSEIIFDLLQKDKRSLDEVYEWAMAEFEIGKYHLNSEMKTKFISIITKIAEAFPPNTIEEKKLIHQFKQDINLIEPNLPIN